MERERTGFLAAHTVIKQGLEGLLGIKTFLFVCLFVYLFRAPLAAYGDSQARGPIGAIAAGLHHSPSNSGSKLQPHRSSELLPQLTAAPDP